MKAVLAQSKDMKFNKKFINIDGVIIHIFVHQNLFNFLRLQIKVKVLKIQYLKLEAADALLN